MRVLHFRSTFTFAGPEVGLLRLGTALRDLDVTPRIVGYYRRRPPEPADHRMVEEGRRLGLDVDQWEDRSWVSWATVRRLARELEHGGFDLLVTHDYKTDLMGHLAARRTRTPRLAVSHGYHLSLLRMRLYRRLDLRILRRFPCVVAVSHDLRRELVAGGLSPGRTVVVHNGIDVERFVEGADARSAAWRDRHATPGTRVALTVARLSAEKGLTYLLEAAARVRRQVPAARFWIAGDGPLRAGLHAQIRRLGLEGTVALLGPQRDVAALMAAADVVVLPSLSEGLSNTLLEAMALARPVVATRVGGTPELVDAPATGWLVSPRDPDALARAIEEVFEDPRRAASVGARARDRVATHFAVRVLARRMVELYRQASAGRPV